MRSTSTMDSSDKGNTHSAGSFTAFGNTFVKRLWLAHQLQRANKATVVLAGLTFFSIMVPSYIISPIC